MSIYDELNKFYEIQFEEICKYPFFAENTVIRCAGAVDFAARLIDNKEERARIIELWDKVWRPKFLGKMDRWDLI